MMHTATINQARGYFLQNKKSLVMTGGKNYDKKKF